jgi:NAD+ kinase
MSVDRDVPVVGLLAHRVRPQAQELAKHMARRLTELGAVVRVPEEDAALTGLTEWAVPEAEFARGLSVAVSVGGDGTMLRTVDLAADVPVLGVNVGHVGYLTAIQPDEVIARGDNMLRDLLEGRYLTESRMTLSVEVDGRLYRALNDAVIEKFSAGNTVRLGTLINDTPFTDYSADGLIVATPTGSTAYAFSVRGPVVSPLMEAMVMVPVAAHMLFDRSLVLSGSETVSIRVLEGRDAALFVDGLTAGVLEQGSVVTVKRHPVPARFITFGPRAFHQILRTKFGLDAAQPWKKPERN